MITANIAGTDLAGTVERARSVIGSEVELPTGYRIAFGGQFEEAERGVRNLALLAVVILLGMYGLLYMAFRDHRRADDRGGQPAALDLVILGGLLTSTLLNLVLIPVLFARWGTER